MTIKDLFQSQLKNQEFLKKEYPNVIKYYDNSKVKPQDNLLIAKLYIKPNVYNNFQIDKGREIFITERHLSKFDFEVRLNLKEDYKYKSKNQLYIPPIYEI